MEHFVSLSGIEPSGMIATMVATWLGYRLLVMLYNVSPLHPLSPIPGPKMAAASYLPEFYYDVICLGRYTTKIREMHEKYGPLIRINPDEVHCSDPYFADEIYAVGGRKRNKTLHQVNAIPVGNKTEFATTDHDLHRTRRAPVAKFFSRSVTMNLEHEIAAHAQRLCDKILAEGGQGAPFDLTIAYSNLSTDVISGYCFGESFGESFNLLEKPGWSANFRQPNLSTLKYWFLFRFFPSLKNLTKLGVWFIDYLPPDIALFVQTMQVDIPKLVTKTINNLNAGIVYPRPVLVGALIGSSLSEEEKAPERISAETLSILGAGTETTAWCLSVMTYHILTNPEIFENLTHELKEAVPDSQRLPHWATLEKLPYLSGVIQEGLRLSYGVAGRTARVPTEEDLVYRGGRQDKSIRYVIPRGYAIGMSAFVSHHDETLFPESTKFQPERWFDPQNRKELDRGFLSFSKGSRACLGMKTFAMIGKLWYRCPSVRVLAYEQQLYRVG
ncbi:trichodiene oxygenase [Diaporthe amygdali]|uniref:trichodiene oxygenase n=1 Tax=Phomopsis amygdali TaxID=1214568 RepID=UPI0022FEE16C|nr:trichodiene oxygenase [Diaporthe amygdali]KAJ0122769.1 trichodiene oxygenase [Diaporthe amygdali]